MLLEAFCATAQYVIVPRMKSNTCYATYDFLGMSAEEVGAWKLAITIPQVRKAHAITPEAYLDTLQGLGIRAAISGTDACYALREEYNLKPTLRRMK